jgi:D-alanyl-D-alanine dipeptidase
MCYNEIVEFYELRKSMALFNDERIVEINCFDNKEKILPLRQIHKNILIDETRSQISSKSDLFCFARESIIEKLIEATNYLPEGYQLLIKEAYRPLARQKKSFEEAFNDYKIQYPHSF